MICFVVISFCQICSAIKGFNFADNQLPVMMGPDNGWLRAEMSGYIPSTLTVCERFYASFNRWGDQFGLWHILSPYDQKLPVFDLRCESTQLCKSGPTGTFAKAKKDYPKQNWLRKWTSVCVAIDFIQNDIAIYFNGRKHNDTKLEESRKKNPKKAVTGFSPDGYFSGNFKTNFNCNYLPFRI